MNSNIKSLFGAPSNIKDDCIDYLSDDVYNNPVNRLNIYANMFVNYHLGFLFNIFELTDVKEIYNKHLYYFYADNDNTTVIPLKIGEPATSQRYMNKYNIAIVPNGVDLVNELVTPSSNWSTQSIYNNEARKLLDSAGGTLLQNRSSYLLILAKDKVTDTMLLKLIGCFTLYWSDLNSYNEESLQRRFVDLITEHKDDEITDEGLFEALDTLGEVKQEHVLDGLTRIYESAFNNLGDNVLEKYHYNLHVLAVLQEWIQNVKDAIQKVNVQMKKSVDVDVNLIKDALVTMQEYFKDIHIYSCDSTKITFLVDTFCDIYSVSDFKILLGNRNSYWYPRWGGLNYVKSRNQLKGFLYDMFANKRYLMRFVNLIDLNMSNGRLARNSRRVVDFMQRDSSYLTNCHIEMHDCFSEAKNICLQALRDMDYDTFFSQLQACVKQISMGDSIVMNELLDLLTRSQGACLLDTKNDTMITLRDAMSHYEHLGELDHELAIDEMENMILGDNDNETN